MRVTNQALFSMVKLNLGKLTEDLAEANKTVASGKRISELSDDPVGLTQILHIKSDLSNMEQLGRNVTHGKAWLMVIRLKDPSEAEKLLSAADYQKYIEEEAGS